MLTVQFVDLRTDRHSKLYGPYEFCQITYPDIRVGENGDEFIGCYDNGEWYENETKQRYSDVIIASA